jgi:hypothetical protein
MSDEITVIDDNFAAMEGMIGDPEMNKALLTEERNMLENAISFMKSLKTISEGSLYRARGFMDMKTYMNEHLGKNIPYALSFAQGLLSLSSKIDDSFELQKLDSQRLKEYVKLGQSADIIQITGEGIVKLTDGNTMTTEQYKAHLKKDLLKEMDADVKESKKSLKQDLEKANREKDDLSGRLESSSRIIDRLQNEKEEAAKLIGIHGDKLSKMVNLNNSLDFFHEEVIPFEGELLAKVTLINGIGAEVRRSEEIIESAENFFATLVTAIRRLSNSWSGYSDKFVFMGMDSIRSESVDAEIETVEMQIINRLQDLSDAIREVNVNDGDRETVAPMIAELLDVIDSKDGDLYLEVLELLSEKTFETSTPDALNSIIEKLKEEI